MQVATEAVVLDMGLYSMPGFAFQHTTDAAGLLPAVPGGQPAPTGADTAAWSLKHTTPVAGVGSATAVQHNSSSDVAGAAAASALPAGNVQGTPAGTSVMVNDLLPSSTAPTSVSAGSAPAVGGLMGCLRFYQILPPTLIERAHIFGNRCVLGMLLVLRAAKHRITGVTHHSVAQVTHLGVKRG